MSVYFIVSVQHQYLECQGFPRKQKKLESGKRKLPLSVSNFTDQRNKSRSYFIRLYPIRCGPQLNDQTIVAIKLRGI